MVATSDNPDVTLTPTGGRSITLNVLSSPVTFTVTAGQHADATHDAVAITHSIPSDGTYNAAGYATSLALPSLSVSVRDDEAPSASVSARTRRHSPTRA